MATGSVSAVSYEIAPVIDEKLRNVRSRKITIGLIGVALASLAVLLVGMLLAMLLDLWTLPGNGALRPWLTVVPLIAAGALLVAGVRRVIRQARALPKAAADVDNANPALEERWSTLAETAGTNVRVDASHTGSAHPAMFRKLASEAVAWAPRVTPQQVVSPRKLSRAGLWLAVPLVAILVFAMVDYQQASVSLRRFFAPGSNITLTSIDGLPNDLFVAKGETAALAMSIAGRIPDEATLEIRDADGNAKSHLLELKEGHQGNVRQLSHRVADVQQPFAYRVTAGDAQSEWMDVGVAARPRIAGVRFQVAPPEYTQKPVIRRSELPRKVRVVEGSQLKVAFRTAEPVTDCVLDFGDGKSAKLSADGEGWYEWHSDIAQPIAFTVGLVESHGLKNRRPRKCRVEVYRDRAPTVKVVSPTAEMAVQPGDEVDIQFEAKDDFAVERAELVVYGDEVDEDGNRQPLKTMPIDLGEMQGAKKIRGSVPLDLSEYDLENGQSISYAVRVYDNRVAPAANGTPALPATNLAGAGETPNNRPSTDKPAGQPDAGATPRSAVAQNEATKATPQPTTPAAGNAKAGNRVASASSASAGEAADKANSESSAATTSSNPSDTSLADAGSPKPTNQEEGGDSTKRDAAATKPSQPSPDTLAEVASPGTESLNGQPTSPSPTERAASGNKTASGKAADNNGGSQLASDAKPRTNGAAAAAGNPNSAANESDSGESAMSDGGESQATDSTRVARSASNNSATDTQGGKAGGSSPNPNPDPTAQPSSTPAGQNSSGSEQGSNKNGESESSTTSNERRLVASDSTDDNAAGAATNQQGSQPNGQGGDATASANVQQSNSNASNSAQAMSSGSQGGQPSGGGKKEQGDVVVPEGMIASNNSGGEKADESNQGNGASNNDPGDSMTRRMLDLPQSGSSQQMTLEIDEFAGSFDGQRREKLAIAISPVLYQLDELLAEVEEATLNVATGLESGNAWQSDSERLIDGSEKQLEECEQLVADLQGKTSGTPYAFIGLQLGLIAETHFAPARDSLWEALESEVDRAGQVRSAWQAVSRARARLAELTASFERIRREHKLAETAEKIKKMYRVFIEDTLPMLSPNQNEINDYERKLAEFDLDEEYLKRLKEVLEMRRDLQAELARLLADDPRLMRRFMDRIVARGDSLRDQMTLLAERQKQLAREVRAWAEADEEARPDLLAAITRMRYSKLEEIARLAAEHDEKFVTWMPLDLAAEHPAFEEALRKSKAAAALALELAALPLDDEGRLDKGRELYDALTQLDSTLRSVDLGMDHEGFAAHLLNRLADVRRLTMLTSSWIRQTELLEKGDYWQEAAVEQYKLAMETDTLAGKLADIEVQLTAQVPGGTEASAEISKKAKELLKTLDTEVSANQLAATFALRRQQGPQSAAKEKAAVAAFDKTERLFDELMRATIDELDKLPVQDPIASLLDDPTLDELLAALENEAQLAELLGIPNRPSNLQIIRDWMQPNSKGNGGSAGRMIAAQLRQKAKQNRRNAEDVYRKALARALKEQVEAGKKAPQRPRSNAERVEWNSLLSKLSEDLEQGDGSLPPEEYRRAIEQYLLRISKMEAGQDD